MPERVFDVMFLCTGNSARSIMAESILRKDGAGHFRTFSAGSHPNGTVNPFALKVLEGNSYPIEGLHSKSWDEFAQADAPAMDFVFTVCDNAAGELCPIWPGHPLTACWGIEDPANAGGTDIETLAAFIQAFRYLRTRINTFISLPFASLDKVALRGRLDDIGRMDGATNPHEKVS